MTRGCSPALPYFNPRPPRGGRPGEDRFHDPIYAISIHALREEGDHGAHLPELGV